MRRLFRIGPLGLALAFATAAHAQDDPRWFLRGGPAFANFDASARVKLGGAPVAGGDASVKNNTGFEAEAGYFLSPRWSVALAIGIPPTARIDGAGTLAAAGKLGTAKYGPSVLSLQYNVETASAWKPYLGIGLNYTLVYHVRDSSIRDLHVSNGYGPTAQAGTEVRLNRHFSWFFDAKKVWVRVNAYGTADGPGGALPARARVTLNPVILNSGLSWHFR